jgi:hypothetical protein
MDATTSDVFLAREEIGMQIYRQYCMYVTPLL